MTSAGCKLPGHVCVYIDIMQLICSLKVFFKLIAVFVVFFIYNHHYNIINTIKMLFKYSVLQKPFYLTILFEFSLHAC